MSDTPLTDAVDDFPDALREHARDLERVYHAAVRVLFIADELSSDPRFDELRKACSDVKSDKQKEQG